MCVEDSANTHCMLAFHVMGKNELRPLIWEVEITVEVTIWKVCHVYEVNLQVKQYYITQIQMLHTRHQHHVKYYYTWNCDMKPLAIKGVRETLVVCVR